MRPHIGLLWKRHCGPTLVKSLVKVLRDAEYDASSPSERAQLNKTKISCGIDPSGMCVQTKTEMSSVEVASSAREGPVGKGRHSTIVKKRPSEQISRAKLS